MAKIFTEYLVNTVVTYQGLNEIVLGIVWLIHSILSILEILDYDSQREFTAYFCFVIVAATLSLFKGPLLLRSIKQSNKIGVLVYLILTFLVLLIATGFVILSGVYTWQQIEELRLSNSSFSSTRMRYYIFYGFVLPILILSFYWFCQFCVFLFYRNLRRNDYSRRVNVGTPLSDRENV